MATGSAFNVPDLHGNIFFAAVASTRMPMVVTDPRQDDNPIIITNQAFLNLTGYVLDEVVGHSAEASLKRTDAGGNAFELLNKPYRRTDLIVFVPSSTGRRRRAEE